MQRRIVEKKKIDHIRKTKAKLAATVAVLIFLADTFTDKTGDAANITYILKSKSLKNTARKKTLKHQQKNEK